MTRGPLRVLVVNGHSVLGGAESWLLQLLDATTRVSPRAVVFEDGPLLTELRSRGIDAQVHHVGRHRRSLPAAVAWLSGTLRQSPVVDVVLANGVKAALVAVPAARLAGVPVVWAKHDHMYDSLARPLGHLADGLVGAVEELVEPCRRSNAVVVPPPKLASPPAGREDARRFWGLTDVTDPVLGMVGRLVPYKGVDDAIRALATVDDWRLVVVGDEDPAAAGEQARLEALASSLGVADRVSFPGAVPGASHWLAGFDAVAVLTKCAGARMPTKEGFGTSAFEAMVAGVPVIAVEGGAVVRRLAGRAGIAVPPGSPSAVAEALAALASPALRREMGTAAQKAVTSHPGAEAAAAMLWSYVAAVAHRPGAGLADGPPVSVITTVKNEEAGIDRLLSLLTPQLGDGDEIVVVDGGSSDETIARAQRWSRVRTLEAPGAGISHGRNQAVEAARNDMLAATDAGCDPHEGWLDALRLGLADGADLVTGLYDVAARSPMEEAFAIACFPSVDEARGAGPWTRLYGALLGRMFDGSLPTGRSVAFTKDAWRKAGGFPENLQTAEDVTFGGAVVAAGGRAALAADAVVTWEQRPELASMARMYWNYGVGDGESGHPMLIGRNLVRMLAYMAAVPAWWWGGRAIRFAIVAHAAAYLSVPAARARRRRAGWQTWLLLPFALAVKDVAKASGCTAGLRHRLVFVRVGRGRGSASTARSRGAGPVTE